MDWVEELRNELEYSEGNAALELHRALVLEEEGKLFFDRLAEEIGRGLNILAAARRIPAKDIHFEHERGRLFEARRLFPYPVTTLSAELGKRHIVLSMKSRSSAHARREERSSTLDYCLGQDQQLYVCYEGQRVLGPEDAAAILMRWLFRP